MPLTKEVSYDVHVLEDGQLQVRTITRIMEDGEELNKHYHRKVVDVGDDVSLEPTLIQEVAVAVHTPERKAARDAKKLKDKEDKDGPSTN
jgi:hypothetical protein